MKKTIWIIGGGMLVSAAFFIAGEAGDIWQSMGYAGIAAAVFLIAFASFYSSSRSTQGNKIRVVTVTGFLLILFAAHYWVGLQEAKKQKQTLVDIRETIEEGIAKSYVNNMLLQTLRSHYQSGSNETDLGSLFQSRYDSLISDGLIEYDTSASDESLKIELVKASPDSVVLVAYSTFVPGKQNQYNNHDGQTGHFEAKGVLTNGGIIYERTN